MALAAVQPLDHDQGTQMKGLTEALSLATFLAELAEGDPVSSRLWPVSNLLLERLPPIRSCLGPSVA